MLNEILRTKKGVEFLNELPGRFQKTLVNMSRCQTEAMGFTLSRCKECGNIDFTGFNSCNDSHCCTCSGRKNEEKAIELMQKTFNCPYFLITFTLPHEFNEILDNQNESMYSDLLNVYMHSIGDSIKYVASTYKEGDKPPLGIPDIMQFLHTWDQKLEKHIHSHVLVSTIGIDKNTKEVNSLQKNSEGNYFLAPSDMISEEYKKRVLQGFEKVYKKHNKQKKFNEIKEKVKDLKFNIHCQSPEQQKDNAVLYLTAYSHKVGLSPARIKKVSDGLVDVARKRAPNECTSENYDLNDLNNCIKIEVLEFLRRFCLHILPHNFKRFRRTGLWHYYIRSKNKSSQIKIRDELLPNQKTHDEIAIILERQKEKQKKELCNENENTVPSILNNFRRKSCSNCDSRALVTVSFDSEGNIKSGYEELTNEEIKEIGKHGKLTSDIIKKLKKNCMLNIHLLSPIKLDQEAKNTG